MKSLYALLLFLCTLGSIAQTNSLKQSPVLSDGDASAVGMSEERLKRIETMLQDAVDANQIPGTVALIARKGKIVFHRSFGMADNASNKKMSNDVIFRIASQSKAITSTAVMMLWEEGKFRLDDPISKYIPEFDTPAILESFNEADSSFTATPSDKKITIRHLLTHTSGLGYGVIDGDERIRKIYAKAGVTDLYTTKDITIEQSIKKLAKLPLHHIPGEKFTYSEGLDVLGYFIEVISGKPFDEFLRERIFDPLGMNDTWFYLPSEKSDRLVSVQQTVNNTWEKFPITFYDPDYPIKGAKRFFSGGAGLSSTAKDYAIFLQMYLNQGEYNGVRILSRTTVRSIMGNHIGNLWGENGPKFYGLAFGILSQKGQDTGGEGSTGTFDWGGYFNTQYFADPVEEVIGILMKQTQGPVNDPTAWKFRQMVFTAIDD
ncbi:MAG: beta-lactamase family protein [Arenibacter sp.]|nr:beta-lactamase family protein [Arenibacter sp.]